MSDRHPVSSPPEYRPTVVVWLESSTKKKMSMNTYITDAGYNHVFAIGGCFEDVAGLDAGANPECGS